jgi:hypothetical protein
VSPPPVSADERARRWPRCAARIGRRSTSTLVGASSLADAEDAVQGFFTRLLRLESLAGVDRERGRFARFCSAASTTTSPIGVNTIAPKSTYLLVPLDTQAERARMRRPAICRPTARSRLGSRCSVVSLPACATSMSPPDERTSSMRSVRVSPAAARTHLTRDRARLARVDRQCVALHRYVNVIVIFSRRNRANRRL